MDKSKAARAALLLAKQPSARDRWFGDSVVRETDGRPRIMYHATGSDISEFKPASHFGTREAAHARLDEIRGWDRGARKERGTGSAYNVMPVHLAIENPLRVSDSEASNHDELINAIGRKKYPGIDHNMAMRKGIVRALSDAGYDGLVYRNRIEDKGRDSYVNFRPDQVKSAIGNNGSYDPNSRDITRASGGRLTRNLGGAMPYATDAMPGMPTMPTMLGGKPKMMGGMSAQRGGGGDSPFGGGIPGLNDGGGGEGAGGNGSGNSAAGGNAAAGTGAAASGDSGTGTAGDGDGQKRGGRIRRADGGVIPPTMGVVPDEHPVVQQAKQVLQTQLPQSKAKQDPMSAVHALSATPQDQAEQVMQQNADRGLIFPQDASANRLRMKLARHKKSAEKGEDLPGMPANPRTVIKAPDGLPDFVAGRVTPQDWVSRHEQLLSPEEIQNSADWYKRVYGTFLQQTKGDEEQAKKYMRGWLVAQQNVDVSGAMNNVLLQNEQMKRGVPEDQMRAAGMPNPTAAARSVLADKPITGVGQKISDFVDAAEGKDVRSWMANHPDGGKPFVVDVHTGRDTGLVDQELINHLTRLGYDPKAIKKLKIDMHASPSETQYENRAHFGHEITNHLNNIGWQGRQDWTPSEVQAVGWMGMTKLTANQADDVVSGLDRNTRRLSMELAPGEGSPWHKKYGDAFSGLKPEDQYELTHHMTQKAIEHASKLAGIDVRDIVHGTGGWQQYQNPSTVGQALATKEGAEIAANALGHLLQQTEVWSNSVKPVTANPKGFAVDFIADGEHNLHTDEGLRDFWSKIMDADPLKGTPKALFQGYQPIRTVDGKVGIRALIDRGGAGTKKVLHDAVEGPIRTMVEGLPFDVHAKMHEAEILKARNDWNEDKHGQAYKSRLVDLLKRDPSAELGRAGQELEEEFQAKLREKGAKVASGAKLQKAAGGSVYRDPYRHARKVVPTTGRYANGGAVDHNPSDAQKAAGNYAKRKISFQGIPISIENVLGSVRTGRDRNGKTWSCKLPADYGYIRGTDGADGDHVDVYVGPSTTSNLVVVVNQCELDGRFDEHKCLVGFETEKAAIDCYCKAFSDGKGADRIKSVEVMSVDAFKQWLKSGKTTRPANGRSIVDRALQLTGLRT